MGTHLRSGLLLGSLVADFAEGILSVMKEPKRAYGQLLLTILCILLSVHFSIAYVTLTLPMVSFHGHNDLVGQGGTFAYRMLPTILWKLMVFVLAPVRGRFTWLHMPYLNAPFRSNE